MNSSDLPVSSHEGAGLSLGCRNNQALTSKHLDSELRGISLKSENGRVEDRGGR